ncbi:MAG TPA: hypothetical protein VD969_18700 [Symbiobacteriaceae bacterium]|nr:hypothetical protein [Symbiobacteriaceae bacterium]
MRHSLHALGQERKALLDRLKSISLTEQPELKRLADEMNALRREEANLRQRHAQSLEEETLRHRERIAGLTAELASLRAGYSSILNRRRLLLAGGGGGQP